MINNYALADGQDKGHFSGPNQGNCALIFQLVGTADPDYYKIFRPECGGYRTALDTWGNQQLMGFARDSGNVGGREENRMFKFEPVGLKP